MVSIRNADPDPTESRYFWKDWVGSNIPLKHLYIIRMENLKPRVFFTFLTTNVGQLGKSQKSNLIIGPATKRGVG